MSDGNRTESIEFDTGEIMALYLAVGYCHNEIMSFSISDFFDTLPPERQEMVLEHEEMYKHMYKKMTDYIGKYIPDIEKTYQEDVDFWTKPRKELK